MSFATSSAAFGIKSSAPANASVFGQKPPATGLFGSQISGAFGQTQTGGTFGQPQQNQAGGLFGQNQASSQQPAGGLFGQTQQNQPAAGGGQFGQPQQQQPVAGGGLFGQPQNQQPAAGGGLFGQPQSQQQQAAPTGGLFGQSQPGGGGLFGATQQNQQPAASGSGLFGSNPNPLFGGSKPAQTGFGLFGNNQQQNQQQQTGLWGNNNASTTTNQFQPQGGLFGSTNNATNSMFGPKPQQQQQQPLGFVLSMTSTLQASQGPPSFTKSTKFNDLPDALKKTLEEIDSHIQGRIQISKELHQRKLGDEATKGQEMIRTVHKDLVNTTTAIRNDLHFTRDLKAKTDLAVQDTIVATRLIDGFRNPHANAAYLKDHAGFPLEFFTRITIQMRERLAWYKSTIEQIERKLSSSAGQAQYTPNGIHATLQAQHATFLALASKTAGIDAQLQKIKQIYTQLWRTKTGSHRDPFELDTTDRADLGFGSLNM
ncbi:hypothetical protein B0H10DRAFT_2162339 [Mycena sp. CBHHK59/15]|nr:hypothetical protein B0H10DRAFT_2162339 [Mycena sp. CBHHK59/15]